MITLTIEIDQLKKSELDILDEKLKTVNGYIKSTDAMGIEADNRLILRGYKVEIVVKSELSDLWQLLDDLAEHERSREP